jgi:hypothetical protein
VRCVQRGGVGVVVYFRKEGRALGEVTKSVSSFLPLFLSLLTMTITIVLEFPSLIFWGRCRYLVYNLRKRGGDSADKYFKSTEMVAGVKDMRFQALMPDVLHWLGIKKIDNMVSMSDMCVFSLLPVSPGFGYSGSIVTDCFKLDVVRCYIYIL